MKEPLIIFEDNHLIVVNKRPSEIVQADKTGDAPLSETLKDFLKKKYNKPGNVFVGVIHRLDRPVSGVVVFAKTSKALARMNELFRERETKKIYWAVVNKKPEKEEGKLVNWLKKNEKLNKSFVVEQNVKDALRAELDYKLIRSSDNYHLLEVELHSGRHHQIRVQLAQIGCIIKGDLKYGSRRSNPDGSIHLHSRSIEFMHPVKNEPVKIIANPPEESLWNYFKSGL